MVMDMCCDVRGTVLDATDCFGAIAIALLINIGAIGAMGPLG